MKESITFFAAMAIASVIFSSCGHNRAIMQNIVNTDSINQRNYKLSQQLYAANDSFYSALNAMFKGNLAPMDSVWSHQEDVTDLGPFGGRIVGWDAVSAEFQKEAGMKLGGKVTCDDIIAHMGNDLAYTICTEAGENMRADGKPVTVSHRATNIFRLEFGKWKLIHHHTDISSQLQQSTEKENK